MNNNKFFASCTRYLEDLLLKEIESYGAESPKVTQAGVHFTGAIDLAYKVCLNSRLASRVFLNIVDFPIYSEKDIYEAAKGVNWNEYFSVNETIIVDAFTSSRVINHSHYASLLVKDGVVDYFKEISGERPTVDTDNSDIRLYLYVYRNTASLYLDLSGYSLDRRGYRLEAGDAPIRENIAAAMLLKSNWDKLSNEGYVLLDPFCGSGTILIEAAMIKANIPPNLNRESFGFTKWKGHDPELWQNIVDEAKSKIKTDETEVTIFGVDKDKKAIGIARDNIARTDTGNMIKLYNSPFDKLDISHIASNKGLIVTNPPYGVRMGNSEELSDLYDKLGFWMKDNFHNWLSTVITMDKTLLKYTGLRAFKVNTMYNGNIKSHLAQFNLDDNNNYRKFEDVKMQFSDVDQTSGVRMVINRLEKNRKQLKKYLKANNITCYRLYDADIPQHSAAIDIYEDKAAVIQEYAPHKSIDKRAAEIHLDEIVKSVHNITGLESKDIHIKQRKRQTGSNQYTKVNHKEEYTIIKENNLSFYVNFADYLDTGIFLDHRDVRSYIKEHSKGKAVLNLFAYTCTASVYSLAGGAKRVISVDTSRKYLDWGRNNMLLNKFDIKNAVFIVKDSIDFLKNDNFTYDLIFIDPPTFSNSKDRSDDFDVQRDHAELIELAVRRLSGKGEIIFSTNFRKFELETFIEEKYHVKEITSETMPKDFERNSKIHRVWSIKIKK